MTRRAMPHYLSYLPAASVKKTFSPARTSVTSNAKNLPDYCRFNDLGTLFSGSRIIIPVMH